MYHSALAQKKLSLTILRSAVIIACLLVNFFADSAFSQDQCTAISPGVEINDDLNGLGDTRCYKLTLSDNRPLAVLFRGAEYQSHYVLEVHQNSPDGTEVGNKHSGSMEESVILPEPAPGDYYVEVRRSVDGSSIFTLKVELKIIVSLVSGNVATGSLWCYGDVQYYSMACVSNQKTLKITLCGDNQPVSRYTLNLHRNSLQGDIVGSKRQEGECWIIEVPSPQTGKYYVEVRNYSDGGRTFVLTPDFIPCTNEISVTVTTNIGNGTTVRVDGILYNAPYNAIWPSGSTHTIDVDSPQNEGTDKRYVYKKWNDSEEKSRIVSPTSNTTYTAELKTQWKPIITLVGTDAEHQVIIEAHNEDDPHIQIIIYAYGQWSDWCNHGMELRFSECTTGSPQRCTKDIRSWIVTSVFAATINYLDLTGINITVTTSVGSGTKVIVDSAKYDAPYITKWAPGSKHTISVDSTQSGGIDKQCLFKSWSDGKSRTHTVSPTVDTTYTADLLTQWKPSIILAGTDTRHTVCIEYTKNKLPQLECGIYGTWSDWCDEGTEMSFSQYTTGSPVGVTSDKRLWTVDSAFSATIIYYPDPTLVDITVSTNISSGTKVIVDNVEYDAPYRTTWKLGVLHTICVNSPQSGGTNKQFLFMSWSDGGAICHTVIPTTNAVTTHKATLLTQFKPIVKLEGTDAEHTVRTEAHTRDNLPHLESGQHGTWSDWCDKGTILTFSEETTGTPVKRTADTHSWTVSSAFSKTIVYKDIPPIKITVIGAVKVIVDGIEYDSPYSTEWVAGSLHSIGVALKQSDDEINKQYLFKSWSDGGSRIHNVSPTANTIYTSTFLTQWKPTITLVGTNSSHKVSTEAHTENGNDDLDKWNIYAKWSDWCDEGTELRFSQYTTGSPVGATTDIRSWTVTSAFTAVITYVPDSIWVYVTVTTNISSGTKVKVDDNEYDAPYREVWKVGASHIIGIDSPQSGGTNKQHVFRSWSDGGEQYHTVTPTTNAVTTYKSTLLTQSRPTIILDGTNADHTVSIEAHTKDGSQHPESGIYGIWSDWCDEDTELRFSQCTITGYPPRCTKDPHSWNITSALSKTIKYEDRPEINITVTTSVGSCKRVIVDGVEHDAPYGTKWVAGSSHTIEVDLIQSGGTNKQCLFKSWSDGGKRKHTVSPTEDATYIADLLIQWKPTITLIGTDYIHTVYTEARTNNEGSDLDSKIYKPWSDWCDDNTELRFSQYTTGSPVRVTTDKRSWTVDSAFSATIEYVPDPTKVDVTVSTNISSGTKVFVDNVEYDAPYRAIWNLGSSHTIKVNDFQSGGPNKQYTFVSWSDGGAIEHTVSPMTNAVTTYKATLLTQYKPTVTLIGTSSDHTVTTEMHYKDGNLHQDFELSGEWSDWCDKGTTLTFSQHTSGTPVGITSDTRSWTVNSAFSKTINYIADINLVNVTVTTNIGSGTTVIVDGQSWLAPYKSTWKIGSTHVIGVDSPQSGGNNKQYVFKSWSDGGAPSHPVLPSSNIPITYTATLITQWKPTIVLNGTGTEHTVSTEAHTKDSLSHLESSIYELWSGWCDEGTELRFSQSTNGSPARTTTDTRSWIVDSAFTKTIYYKQDGNEINVTLTTNIGSGTTVMVDGKTYDAPYSTKWTAGSSHIINTDSPQSGGDSKQYVYQHLVVTPSDPLNPIILPSVTAIRDVTYTFVFLTQWKPSITLNGTDAEHTVSTEAHTNNNSSHLESGIKETWSDWCDEGKELRFSQSTTGSPTRYTTDNRSWTVNSAFSETINYSQQEVISVTIVGCMPKVIVDDIPYDLPYTWKWIPGSKHNICAVSPQSGGENKQYVFKSWSDGGAMCHEVSPTLDTTYTMTCLTQWKPNIILMGTDAEHTISTEAHTKNESSHLEERIYREWSDWCDENTELRFSQQTTGSPARNAIDPRSWVVASAFSKTINYAEEGVVNVSIRDTSGASGSTITVPIEISDTTGKDIIGIKLKINYDPNILTAKSVTITDTLASGWIMPAYNITTGQIIVTMAGTAPLVGSGSLVKIVFDVSVNPSAGDTSYLMLSDVGVNEGSVPTNVINGTFTICMKYGDVSRSCEISAYDAALVLQYCAELTQLTPMQLTLSDVSGDGTITPYDAALILQYCAGIREKFPVEDNSIIPANIESNISSIPIAIPTYLQGLPGEKNIAIPVNINSDVSGLGIIGVGIRLTYDANILTARSAIVTDTIASGWGVPIYNVIPGQTNIFMAGALPLSGSGVLVKVIFDVSDSAIAGRASELNLIKMDLNEGSVPTSVTNGLMTVIGNVVISELQSGWNMISFPGTLSNPSVESLIPQVSNIIPPLYTYDPESFSYKEVTEVETGKGYWTLSMEYETISANITEVKSLVLNLKAGWNMIGGVVGNVDFTDPQDDPDESIILPIYTYNPDSFGYEEATSMESGKGYWVLAIQDCTLTLNSNSAPSRDNAVKAHKAKPDWIVPIQLITARGIKEIALGVQLGASDGFDPYIDKAMPPKANMLANQAEASFLIDNPIVNRLGRDIKNKDNVIWNMEVESSRGTELKWDISSLPVDRDMSLHFAGIDMNMRNEKSIKVPSGIHIIIITLKDMIPAKAELLQNYPNPFNPDTWIPYHLPEVGMVVISIYDVNGRIVRKLDLGNKEAGIYASRDKAAYWDGRNDSGERVSSGVYFYQIQSGRFSKVMKLVVVE